MLVLVKFGYIWLNLVKTEAGSEVGPGGSSSLQLRILPDSRTDGFASKAMQLCTSSGTGALADRLPDKTAAGGNPTLGPSPSGAAFAAFAAPIFTMAYYHKLRYWQEKKTRKRKAEANGAAGLGACRRCREFHGQKEARKTENGRDGLSL